MTRSTSRRSAAVQAEKAHAPTPPAADHRPAEATSLQEPETTTPWYWRVALFLWVASFIGLFVYELLTGILKAW